MTVQERNSAFPILPLLVCCVLACGALIFLTNKPAVPLTRYFGAVPPAIAAAFACAAGVAALAVLQRRFGFRAVRGAGADQRRGWWAAMALTIPFMALATVADRMLGFPADINVPPPAGFAFYPAIALVAQFVLHIVPLAIVLLALTTIARRLSRQARTWLAFGLVAAVEAVFQVWSGLLDGEVTALELFVLLHVYAFGIVEFTLFRRFDFVTMYLFRLIYYGYWHLLWGYLRLQIS